MKTLISGGHLTPALAYIDYVTTHFPDNELVFVGRRYSQESSKQVALEQTEVEKRNIVFIPLSSGKLTLHNPFLLIIQAFRFLISLIKCIMIVFKTKPDIYVSFGSYLAAPIGVACWLQGVPIITHEQTRTLGFANRLLMHLADKIAISFPETKKQTPKAKTVVTGNLIRQGILVSHSKPNWVSYTDRQPLLYITGGSQGSEIINVTVSQMLKSLLKDWIVIHQCGPSSHSRNYLKDLEKLRVKLPGKLRYRYMVKEWISETELSWIYRNAQVCISRAGANTTLELTAFSIPTIYIPLPFSHADEQQQNAEYLKKQGMAVILPQQQLTPESLLKALETVKKKYPQLKNNLKKTTVSLTAAEKLHALVKVYEKNTTT